MHSLFGESPEPLTVEMLVQVTSRFTTKGKLSYERRHAICTAWFQRIKAAYGESHRHYHTMCHIEKGLEHIRILYRGDRRARDEIIVAYIFHDIVYVVGARDNEEKSAEVCRSFLMELHASESVITRICWSIVDTSYEATPRHEDGHRVRDVDWLMFAAPPEMFAADCLALQSEIGPIVGMEVFVRERLKFLEQVQKKVPSLYHAQYLQKMMTPHVLANIKAETTRLRTLQQ